MEPQDLSLHRPDRHPDAVRDARRARHSTRRPRSRPARARETARSVSQHDAARRVRRRTGSPLTSACSRICAPAAARRGGERRGQRVRVDHVVVGHVKREPDGRRQPRLEPARLARPQAPDRQPISQPQLELTLERLRLVGVTRDQERPARRIADGSTVPDGGSAARRRELRIRALPLRRPSSSSGSSAAVVSATGASIPAATCDVPRPASPRSSTVTRRPRSAARHAIARPIAPAPMTTTSTASELCCGDFNENLPTGIIRFRFRRSAKSRIRPLSPIGRAPVAAILARRLLAD